MQTDLNDKLKAFVSFLVHCILPLIILFLVCPFFSIGWSLTQLLSFIPATRNIFFRLDVFWWAFYQRLVLFFAENWSETEVYLYGDVPEKAAKAPPKESIIFMCNHQCSFDWIIADILAVRHNSLGNIRYVLKNSLRFIPWFGYFFKLHGCVYVNRGAHDESAYRNQLISLSKRGNYWLTIFPEGTRFRVTNKKALAVNRAYAEKYKLPTFDLVLTPKHRGFYHAVQSLGPSLDAVYDATIAYEPPGWKPDGNQPKIPSMASYLCGETKRLHILVNRIPVSEIPKDEDGFQAWLCDRFRSKDEILKKFYSKGGALVDDRLPVPSRLDAYSETLPYVLLALGLTFVLLLTDVGRPFYCAAAIISSLLTVAYMALVPDRLAMV